MFKTPTIGLSDARVVAFRATGLALGFKCGAQVLVIDRQDGMADFALSRRAFQMTGSHRSGGLDVIAEKSEDARVIARLDCTGQSNLELVRRLNHTGFRGTLIFAGTPTGRTTTLMRLLSGLAIDFQVDQSTFDELDASLPMTFNAA